MADAIADLSKSTGEPPIILSLCQWGREQPWLWAREVGQSWRVCLSDYCTLSGLTMAVELEDYLRHKFVTLGMYA